MALASLLVALAPAAPALVPPQDPAPPAPTPAERPARRNRERGAPPTVVDDGTPPPPPADLDEAAVIAQCAELLVAMQEDYTNAEAEPARRREWPYEGVYRVRNADGESVIPPGYRVGGTSIAAWALLATPGYREDAAAQAAVAKGLAFVLEMLDTEPMRPGFAATYDVRGWGHTYALWFLLQLRSYGVVPAGFQERVDAWIPALIDTLEATEIRPGGGWNYARSGGFDGPGNAASPFMTGPTLFALFEARRQGLEVEAGVVERALDALEATRIGEDAAALSYGYSRGDSRSGRPGAMGRLTSGEVALYLAGRSDEQTLASGIQCFIEHWKELEVRRRQSGTHIAPYGVAPYYVYFAHYHTALAIAQLPPEKQKEWRVKYLGRLFQTRLPSGGWNDRVFDRSESYGTAMAALSLMAKDAPVMARWDSPPVAADAPDASRVPGGAAGGK